jgi:hypothetical protein
MPMFVGLDLGQAQDPTALAVVEKIYPLVPEPASYRPSDLFRDGQPTQPVRATLPPLFHVRHLERPKLGTPYPKIVELVKRRLQHPDLRGATLVVDATGVGRAVIDMFRDAGLHPKPVTITSGDAVSYVDGYWRTPKRDLVGVLQVLLQSERLKVAEELPDAQLLTRELLNFKVKITEAAHDTYGAWREGEHDDLVLSVSLAIWFAEHGVVWIPPRTPPVSQVTQW